MILWIYIFQLSNGLRIFFLASTSDIEDNTESTDKSINTKATTESAEGTESTTKSGVNTVSTTKITDTESTTRRAVTVVAQKDEPVSTGIIVVIVLTIGVTMTITGFVAYK